MSDGTLSVRRRQPKASELAGDHPFSADKLHAVTFESFLGAAGSNIGAGVIKSKAVPKPIADADELRIERRRRTRLKDYDKLLKKFKYSAALDSVLKGVSILELDIGILS
jgi:U3 small nucleolar RNA-associated protein 15